MSAFVCTLGVRETQDGEHERRFQAAVDRLSQRTPGTSQLHALGRVRAAIVGDAPGCSYADRHRNRLAGWAA
jgi:hypothetical protein